MNRTACFFFVGACAAVVGCRDSGARMTGTLGDRTLRATGTVAAWIDATTYETGDGGVAGRVQRSSESTELHIEFFEPVFDPTVDFGTLSAGERTSLTDSIARGDHVAFTLLRGEALRPGDVVETLPDEGLPPEVLPFVSNVTFALAEPIADGAAYPDEVVLPGTDITASFTVDETTPTLAGSIEVDVAAAAGEDGAAEGSIVVDFTAELLAERVAECNFDRGGAGVLDPCTLKPLAGGALPGF